MTEQKKETFKGLIKIVGNKFDEYEKAKNTGNIIFAELYKSEDDPHVKYIYANGIEYNIDESDDTIKGVNIDEKPLTPNNGVVTIETVTEKELTRTYLQEGISGTQFDAARHILGGDWRIPTPTDFNELLDNCDITIVLDDGEKGQRYTSRINGNSIFIKLGENYSGLTHFIIDGAIATNYTPKQKPAVSLQYGALPTKITKYNLFNTSRYDPAHIRPVSMTQGVDLGLPSGLHWAATNLSDNGLVTSDKDLGDKYAFGELTSKTTYTWNTYMCTAEECGTLKDPLAMEITDLGDNEKLLSGTGLNLVRKRIYEMIGSLGLLNTTAKTNLVDAINEVLKGVSDIIIDTYLDEHSTNAIANNVVAEALGNLYDLTTEEKQSLVGAINELSQKAVKSVNSAVPDLTGNVDIDTVDYDEIKGTGINYFNQTFQGTQFDAATHILGKKWMIPTREQCQELLNNCTAAYSIDEETNTPIYTFTSQLNGNKIIIPSRQSDTWFWYMTSSLRKERPSRVHLLSAQNATLYGISNADRASGWSIRPITNDSELGVDLGLPSGTHWAEFNLCLDGFVTKCTDRGNIFSCGEVITKENYTWENYMCSEIECGTAKDPMKGEDYNIPHNIHDDRHLTKDEKKCISILANPQNLQTTSKEVVGAINELLQNGSKVKTVNNVAPDENGNIDVPYITDRELNKTYFSDINIGISGSSYDVARHLLGGDWRLPTRNEVWELLRNEQTIVVENNTQITTVHCPLGTLSFAGSLDEHYFLSGGFTDMPSRPDLFLGIRVAPRISAPYNGAGRINTDRCHMCRVYAVSPTQGTDLGLSVKWALTPLMRDGTFADSIFGGDYFAFGELVPKATYTWGNYMCTQEQCGTSVDPLMGYYEELEETDHYLSTRGVNIVRKQLSDKMNTKISSAVKALGIKNVRWADENKEELIIELNS